MLSYIALDLIPGPDQLEEKLRAHSKINSKGLTSCNKKQEIQAKTIRA